MIIQYDTRPDATVDEKLRSLMSSVQRAFDEQYINRDNLYKSLLSALGVQAASLKNEFTSLEDRVNQRSDELSEAVAGALIRLTAVEGQLATLSGYYTALEARVTALENE